MKSNHDGAWTPEDRVDEIDQYLQDNALHVITAMGEGVALLDPDGRIRKVNPAFAALTEYGADDLEHSTIQQLLPAMFEENAQVIEETLVRVALKQGAPDEEDALHVITPKGTERWLVPSLAPIESLEGRTVALVFTLRDITARIQAQQTRKVAERAYQERLRQLADRLASTKEEERRAVATQLHDTVIQTLSLCTIRLGSLRESSVATGHAKDVDDIRAMLDAALAECRHMLEELTPPLLYELGLGPALLALAEKYEHLYNASIQVDKPSGENGVPHALQVVLFESVRELVMNAIKHAGDCRIHIRVKEDGVEWVVQVEDDGRGFEGLGPEGDWSPEVSGFGLFNVRERLHHVGGTLEISSTPGQGTCATIRAPFSGPAKS